MKTAEELAEDNSTWHPHNNCSCECECCGEKWNEEFRKWIKKIQLDAWKQGMTDAAEIADEMEPSGILGIRLEIYLARNGREKI